MYYGSYPYVTGRDTSASAICSEAGVGPTKIDNVLIVFKAFITRVGAGDLPGELSRDEAIRRQWFEIAAGTGRERRSAPFNAEIARRTVMLNGATQAACTKFDILYPDCKGAQTYSALSRDAKQFIKNIEQDTGVPVMLIGTGPGALDIIDRRPE